MRHECCRIRRWAVRGHRGSCSVRKLPDDWRLESTFDRRAASERAAHHRHRSGSSTRRAAPGRRRRPHGVAQFHRNFATHSDWTGAGTGFLADRTSTKGLKSMGSPRIAFIGAGSSVFARALIRDTYTFPALRDADLRLMDPDPGRLADTEAIANRLKQEYGGTGPIASYREVAPAIDSADFVITMFQIGGYEPATVTDFEIPKKYGLRQTIADTLGIGGIMRALRSIPVLNDLAQQMERSCPDALLLNYVNPMAPLVWAASKATSIRTVGLCHSVQGTAAELATFLDIPPAEIDYDCAGINHMAFYTRLERNGEDLYPILRAGEALKLYPAWEAPRMTLMRDFGYFVTESSEHLSEYVPWLIKDGRPDLIERFNIPLDEYPARCVDQIDDL